MSLRLKDTFQVNVLSAETATKATSDANGNNIATTYATKEQLTNLSEKAATTSSLGLVKVGTGISVSTDGTISADIPAVATKDKAGTVRIGNNLSITEDGVLSADAQKINTATTTTEGIVKLGATSTPTEAVAGTAAPSYHTHSNYVDLTSAQSIGGIKTFTSQVRANASVATSAVYSAVIEFNNMGTSAGHGGALDFHFNDSTADYTSRIIENASGNLKFTNNLEVAGTSKFTGNITDAGHHYFANGTTYYVNSSGAAKFASMTSAGAVSGTTATFSGVTKITNTTASSSNTTGALVVSGGIGAAGNIYGNAVYGAVYNDYAEYRNSLDNVPAGYVVVEDQLRDDLVTMCTTRCARGAMIVSDTYGFAIGKNEVKGEHNLPIAVSGRVLVYTDKPRDQFKVGDVVCTGLNGTVSKMKWYERILHPECILGTVSSIPTYEEWGTNKTKVNNRIWIKLK